jgi:hypothetical protein
LRRWSQRFLPLDGVAAALDAWFAERMEASFPRLLVRATRLARRRLGPAGRLGRFIAPGPMI